MKPARGLVLQLAVAAVSDLFVGYLVVESLNAFGGARYDLPISRFLVSNAGLSPALSGAVVLAGLAAFGAGYGYWLWRYTPEMLGKFVRRGAAKPKRPTNQGMRVADLQLAESGEAKPFVDVVQLEGYPLNIYAAVTKDEGKENYTYTVIEPSLSTEEKARLAELKKLLLDELDVDLRSIETSEEAEEYLSGKVRQLVKKYRFKIPPATMTKVLYYLTRDYIHLGKIEPLMRDKLIEDISCDGAGVPIYIWYRDYESIPTNIMFETEEELDSYVSKLAYSAGKHVSLAEPIVDASLADGSRIHLTYGKEVTQKGSTFTIRKFRVDPLTIVDLISYKTMSSDVAAYLWYLIEKKLALLVAGSTASGKTTTLNALSVFIEPGEKIVSVEDSVTRDAEVLVKQDGVVRKVAIGDFVDGELERSSARTEKGSELAHPRGLEVMTSGASGVTTWSPCTALIRHLVNKEFVKVTTRTGKTVTVTSDHSLFSLGDSGSVEDVLAGRLGVGSFIATPRAYPQEVTRHRFDLAAIPSFSDSVFKPVGGDNGNGVLLQYRVHAKHSPLSIPSTLVLDEDIAFLAGLWLADGFYGDRTMGFSVEEKRVGPRMAAIAKKLGVNITRHSDGVSLLIHSKPLKAFFEQVLGLTGDDYSRHVPEVFFNSGESVVASLLRGYFTGDGSVEASEVTVTSVSERLLRDVQTLLLRFGISLSIGSKRSVGSFGGVGTLRGRIAGTAQVGVFRDKVGFEDESKMAKIASRYKTSKYYLDPIPLNGVLSMEIRRALDGITQTSLGQRLRKGLKRRAVHRATLLELGRVKEAYRESRGFALATSSHHFEEVVSVEKETREEMVYDLSVPETGRFIANNILCHNTAELNLPHENWIQSVTRGVGTPGEITMFDLLKASLRQRPDVLIVGEVRGEEAFTLMQSISSVTGDTPILVRENGSTSLRPISEFVDRYYQGDAERVPVGVEGPEVLSFDNRGVVQFHPVRYVLRHKASEIYGVRYTGGRVRATGSHSVFVFDENCKVVPRPVSKLNKDDIMVSFVGSSIDRMQAHIDVKSALVDATGHATVETRSKASCPRCGVAETKKAGHSSGKQRFWCYPCKRTFLESPALTYVDELASKDGNKLVAFTKSLPLSATLPADRLLARVLGIYMADGCVKHDRNSARVVFTLGTPEKRLFIDDLFEFFGMHGSAPTVDERGTYATYEFNHSVLAELFESLCGRELKEKKIPDFIWTSPPDVVDAFISGWNADARRTGNPNWTSISSARPDLVASLSWLARMNGRPTFVDERNSKYPCVMISTQEAQPLKSSQTIPAKPLLRLAKLLGSTARTHIPVRKAKVISKRRARLALEEILARKRFPVTWEASELVATIRALLDGTMVAAPVRTVERIPFEGFVYDLSVPGTEAFFGGDSPVALHNTGHGGLGTIHADSVEAVINRLTTEPMNIPRSLVGGTLDCILLQLKLRMGDQSVRRVVAVTEVVGHDPRTDEIILNDAFKWDPVSDKFSFTGRSKLFDKITQRYGTRPDEVRREIEGRKTFLDWLVAKNIRTHAEVSNMVREFYAGPYAVINKAKAELEGLKP